MNENGTNTRMTVRVTNKNTNTTSDEIIDVAILPENQESDGFVDTMHTLARSHIQGTLRHSNFTIEVLDWQRI